MNNENKNNLPKTNKKKCLWSRAFFFKATHFYNKNINNIMDFFKIWLWYIFTIPLCINNYDIHIAC